MSVEFDRGSPGKFDSRTLNRKTLSRWTGRSTPLTGPVLLVYVDNDYARNTGGTTCLALLV